MSDLRKCPFCGGEAEMFRTLSWEWFVECKSCRCRTVLEPSSKDAEKKWNRRDGEQE